MISLIFLAGGIGSRMGTSLPKQYLPLGGKPIALHSLELFLQIPEITEAVIVCDSVHQHFFSSSSLFALPGKRRQDSVYSGLLKARGDLILIHDSARPFVEEKLIYSLLEAAQRTGAAALGVPVTNTLKKCHSNRTVEKTVDRSQFWEIQTPQAIKKDLLLQAFQHARTHQLDVTDDLSLVEAMGAQTEVVPSSPFNFKITTPFDLLIAETYQANR